MSSTNAERVMKLRVKPVDEAFFDEYPPRYASSGAAGMDLCACVSEPVRIRPMERVKIPTGIAIQLPSNDVVALVYARSGLAIRQGLALANGVGVVDSDYTGELQVLMMNYGDEEVEIARGDRVAQLVIAPIYLAELTVVSELTETARGSNGFGSTGINQ